MTIVLSLASSLLWGVADFLGGKTARRLSALVVVLLSQAAGLVLALLVAAGAGAFPDPLGYLPWAVGAGVAGATAVLLFYRALAIGTMGVVAPLAALGVVVPVGVDLVTGHVPSAVTVAGIVIAVVGVVATAGPTSHGGGRDHTRSIVLAVGAALGFGLLQIGIARGSDYSTLMTMVAMRGASVPLLVVATILTLRARSARGDAGEGRVGARTLLVIVAIGVFDVGANLLFAVASTSGALAVVAVLGSLYPAATVVLARFVDHERLSRTQNLGVAGALAGVVMIAAG